MRITDYEKVQDVVANNLILLDGDTGTKTILAKNLASSLMHLLNSKEFIEPLDMGELPKITAFQQDDKLLVGNSETNRGLNITDFYYALIDVLCRDGRFTRQRNMRSIVFRGADLTKKLPEILENMDGDDPFHDIFLLDHFVFPFSTSEAENFNSVTASRGVHAYIVDFNYYQGIGHTQAGGERLQIPHITLMFDQALRANDNEKFKMYKDLNKNNGYYKSDYYNAIEQYIHPILNRMFGSDHLMVHPDLFVTNIKTDTAYGIQYHNSCIAPPTEVQLCGFHPRNEANAGTVENVFYTDLQEGIVQRQFSAMKHAPGMAFAANGGANYWLRDHFYGNTYKAMAVRGGNQATLANNGTMSCNVVFNLCKTTPVIWTGDE